ncbi:MAG: hypothetical protein QGG69_00440, partial [Kiritimatiellia bacterium]|nr:hypothetical protein [Kiritimatiellia bacterium]
MEFKIKQGFDVGLAGRPDTSVVDLIPSETVAVYPLEFTGMKQRLLVAEGDIVKQGAVLMENKAHQAFKLRAPAGGVVSSITRGERRFVERIIIKVDVNAEAETFTRYEPEAVKGLDRQAIIDQLITTGYLSLIRQRPFSQMADPEAHPKSIFVNAMNTAPFQADAGVVAASDPLAFQAGLDLMTRLTDGEVHLCVGNNAGDTLKGAQRVSLHTFSGPHPSGNNSVHISRIDPMAPTDVVWTIKAVDVASIGRLFLDGTLPVSRVISLGGPSVKPEARSHYRIRAGGDLAALFDTSIEEGDVRIVGGDVLAGCEIPRESHLGFHQSSVTVIPATKERYFLGWTMPGLTKMSFSRLFASTWLPRKQDWNLGTS